MPMIPKMIRSGSDYGEELHKPASGLMHEFSMEFEPSAGTRTLENRGKNQTFCKKEGKAVSIR